MFNANALPLLALLATLPLAALATGTDDSTTLDPVEVNATLHRELLVQVVELGLERGRSDRKEDIDKIACVRDKKPGTRFPQIRCATNRDWQTLANLSYSRATVGTTTRPRSCKGSCGYSVLSMLNRQQSKGNTNDLAGGVLEVSPNMLLGKRPTLTPEQRGARIAELMGALAIAKTTDEFATPPEEVARFARLNLQVAESDDATAERAIVAAGYTVEQYNAMVDRLETSKGFRQRVALAAVMQDPSLAF